MKPKDSLEFHALQSFIGYYNATHSRQLSYLRACIPPMPDTLCRLNRKEIGIEVAHTYGTGTEAALRLGNRQIDDFPYRVHSERRIIPLTMRTLDSLNKVLAKKATRSYNFRPTWLLVRNACPMWSLVDYRKHKSMINIANGHPFSQIWFLCDVNSIEPRGIMRLA